MKIDLRWCGVIGWAMLGSPWYLGRANQMLLEVMAWKPTKDWCSNRWESER